ncbi:AAA family ATPase [Paenibacillus marinisediminis]
MDLRDKELSGQPNKEAWTSAFVKYGWQHMIDRLNQVVVGKPETIRLACLTMLAGGHLLLEDVPGVGKTLLARTMARLVDSSFRRVQMTPDTMPADITGSMMFEPASGQLRYSEGPLQAHVVLADELNRAPARTQSALLEAMEERAVTVDGVTRPLPQPFMLIATQNPLAFEGTYRLPEAELDRFMMRLSLGYPAVQDEADMLLREQARSDYSASARSVQPVLTTAEWALLIRRTRAVHMDAVLCRYIADMAQASRQHADVMLGVSPRGAIAWMQCAQAQALFNGRVYVTPDDVKAVAVPVLAHRLVLAPSARTDAEAVVRSILQMVQVPNFKSRALDGAQHEHAGEQPDSLNAQSGQPHGTAADAPAADRRGAKRSTDGTAWFRGLFR